MTLQAIPIDVPSRFGVTIRNTLLAHDSATPKLLVLLPGKGYTCDYPLMYYLREIALQHHFDVLSLQYGFQVANVELTPENIGYMQEEVTQALQTTLERGYRQVCLAGKSLGTPLASELARSLSDYDVSLILLTPIGGALHGLSGIPTLAVIGTDDALYSPELVAAIDSVQWRVFEGLNHSLEARDNWRTSLLALPEIMSACESFLLAETS